MGGSRTDQNRNRSCVDGHGDRARSRQGKLKHVQRRNGGRRKAPSPDWRRCEKEAIFLREGCEDADGGFPIWLKWRRRVARKKRRGCMYGGMRERESTTYVCTGVVGGSHSKRIYTPCCPCVRAGTGDSIGCFFLFDFDFFSFEKEKKKRSSINQ